MKAPRARLLAVVLLIASPAACGKKGNPQAPLRPVPAAVSGFSAERAGTAVTVHFTVPDGNLDGSAPPAVDRVEVFGLTLAADAVPPTPAQLVLPANVITSIAIRSTDEAKPGGPPDPRPAPGDVARFVETVARPNAPTALVRYYAVVPAAGRRRGPLAEILRVPLTVEPGAPAGLKADYSESTLTIAWQAVAAAPRYVVEETGKDGAQPTRLSAAPIAETSLDVPVRFGETRCFVVRSVDRRDGVSVVSAQSAPVCVTMIDRFGPPAPTTLLALPGDGGVDLSWKASVASDLAGYIVLRGDDANGTLQRLTPELVAGTAYRDLTARPGATYVYAVVAVDKSAPPNRSGESNREIVTARQPPVR